MHNIWIVHWCSGNTCHHRFIYAHTSNDVNIFAMKFFHSLHQISMKESAWLQQLDSEMYFVCKFFLSILFYNIIIQVCIKKKRHRTWSFFPSPSIHKHIHFKATQFSIHELDKLCMWRTYLRREQDDIASKQAICACVRLNELILKVCEDSEKQQ